MIYLDTSVLVGALTPDAATPRIQQWLSERPAGELVISGWVVTELASALSIKVRTGTLDLAQRAEVLSTWQRLQADHLHVSDVTQSHFEKAARFADQHDLQLRAGDALHLAIAASAGHRLATLDKRMAAAAPRLGVPVITP
jgi:predicted nucleic acid-binding protein